MNGNHDNQQKYLYCIIQCGEEMTFDGANAIGGRGDVVHTVAGGNGLAMVVSDSLDKKYDTSRANLMAHETVIEAVMKRGFTVLPVRFGTVTREGSTSPVEDIRQKVLNARAGEFYELLEEMGDKLELGLKSLWRDEQVIYDEIIAQNPRIRAARDRLLRSRRSPEATHFERMRLGEAVKEALDRKREAEARRLLSTLRPIAYRVRENKTVTDRMVLNAAFLASREREGEFDGVVTKLGEELGERMSFKYSGPNPPFNFVEIVVTWT